MNKDIDLQKIQILNDCFRAYFNISGSIIAGGFIALLVFFTTLYYATPVILLPVYTLLWVGFGYLGKRFLDNSYNEFLTFIDNLHMKVERGETLPSITELKKIPRTETTK